MRYDLDHFLFLGGEFFLLGQGGPDAGDFVFDFGAQGVEEACGGERGEFAV